MAKIYVASSWRNDYQPVKQEPELMYKMFDGIFERLEVLNRHL